MGNFDALRERLVDDLRVIHDAEPLRMTIVFDGKGNTVTVERPTNNLTFSVVYTPSGMSADELIEQLVQKTDKATEVTVFSRDNLIAAAVRAYGGFLLPPEALWEWIDRSRNAQITVLNKQRQADARKWKRSEVWDQL